MSSAENLNKKNEIAAKELCKHLLEKDLVITGAESCTGGLGSVYITGVDGSSKVFDRSFITYSNSSKMQMLGVAPESLLQYGAVSEAVAKEMLLGAIENSNASVGFSITGIAGPGGGTLNKPVGTVCMAWGTLEMSNVSTQVFEGDRSEVRLQAVSYIYENLLIFLNAYR